jgi:Uma2 family endonuclease
MALWREPVLTADEEDDSFLAGLADDREDAPWMVMGTQQFWSASTFAHSLRAYARAKGLQWFVASMLPIRFEVGNPPKSHQLSPDCFVAFAPDHPRSSYNVSEEGAFPVFVLEVVSPSSVERDNKDKLRAYRQLGAREYALFTPGAEGAALLAGYRRDRLGRMVPWQAQADGSLWSDVLGVSLVLRGDLLRVQTAQGELLRTLEEAEAELEHLRHELNRQRDTTS